MAQRRLAAHCDADGEPAGWQARKSASTRLQIVEATLRCFDKLGYFHTTTPAIAEEAGLSRGAMLHHFPSRMDVVRAAIEHLYAKRLRAFRAAIEQLPPGSRLSSGALDAYWNHVNHPMYAVFLEFYVAARTDPELAAILLPAERAFERELRLTAREVFPDWSAWGTTFDYALQRLTWTMDGVAVHRLKHGEAASRQPFIDYLAARIDSLNRKLEQR